MVEPIELLSLILDLTSQIIAYVVVVKDASQERHKLVTETTSASGLLSNLKSLTELSNQDAGKDTSSDESKGDDWGDSSTALQTLSDLGALV
ncbi:hypothetical protein MMC25_004401 [Agyrium rufum]|nr:hypothetical protein [Agyrium rufum]